MADQTPRLMWQNLVQLAPTLVAASSVNAANPKAWVRDTQVTKAWRSKLGWNVVAGFNDKLDFSEAGNARVATLTAGNYADGAAMATQVQTAMNAAPSHTNTYTVTYSTTTHKFTIARASGSDAVVLKWSTGTNAATSVGKDLGFDTSADDSGGTSYEADNASYHTREWVKLDLASALAVSVGAVVGHVPLAVGGLIKVQGNSTDAWTSPTVNSTLAGDDRIQLLFFNEQTLRYWRFLVDDVQNTRGYSQIAVAYLGTYFQPGRSILQGYAENAEDLSTVSESEQGSFYQDKKGTRLRWGLQFPRLRLADKTAFDAMLAYLGVGRPLFVALDPQNRPGETRYGIFDRPYSKKHSVGDGSPPERWDVGVSFLEAIG